MDPQLMRCRHINTIFGLHPTTHKKVCTDSRGVAKKYISQTHGKYNTGLRHSHALSKNVSMLTRAESFSRDILSAGSSAIIFASTDCSLCKRPAQVAYFDFESAARVTFTMFV